MGEVGYIFGTEEREHCRLQGANIPGKPLSWNVQIKWDLPTVGQKGWEVFAYNKEGTICTKGVEFLWPEAELVMNEIKSSDWPGWEISFQTQGLALIKSPTDTFDICTKPTIDSDWLGRQTDREMLRDVYEQTHPYMKNVQKSTHSSHFTCQLNISRSVAVIYEEASKNLLWN